MEKFKKTLITFDKGGIWEPIKAPRGNRICEDDEDCSLHLNSVSDMSFGPLYSVNNALGILVATGNVGYHLAREIDEVNTFLSRNGGKDWFKVRSLIYINSFLLD